MKNRLGMLTAFLLVFTFISATSASAAEPGRSEVRVLVKNAAASQYKLTNWKPYSQTAVSSTLRSSFTNGFIDQFFRERMATYGTGKSGLLYKAIPPTDNMAMILTSFSWNSDTKVRYSRSGQYKYIKVSEYIKDEMKSNHNYTVTLIKRIDSAQGYKILSIDRQYE
ncbi:DUF3993 domain-containing protein [Neobacillus sp. PS3-34]|uniref:DUF3993 domain-containing protein n=1 Tax=Neobacillus sp. PS3-34 TaxID=3070678 RepID=UPI0027E136C3|nr:DUF3993 domain-containing protein [Neobacillus sp. PS3-34]WML46659.1 DUF3993 domain-containing protein [Neobacillus sp. PS3-34]